jgi:hypothetical protein
VQPQQLDISILFCIAHLLISQTDHLTAIYLLQALSIIPIILNHFREVGIRTQVASRSRYAFKRLFLFEYWNDGSLFSRFVHDVDDDRKGPAVR